MADADSFGFKLKNELCNTDKLTLTSKKALQYGLMLFSRNFSFSNISIQTEYECVAVLYQNLLYELCNIKPALCVSGAENKLYYVSIVGQTNRQAIMNFFAQSNNDISQKINMSNIESDEDMPLFIRGVFLTCGNVSNPNKSYRLEFVVPRFTLSKNLAYVLEDTDIAVKTAVRKGSYVFYIKDSGMIEDVITYMGATMSTLELMDIKIFKDLRNNINRKTNCETANIEKTITASAAQINDIKYLRKTIGLKALSDDLHDIAVLRLKYPESSLSELGTKLRPPLSRSGVNHRLRRLSVMAQEDRESKGRKCR